MVGVPADKWMQVRSDYITNRKRSHSNGQQASAKTEKQASVVEAAKNLFAEDTVHVIDE